MAASATFALKAGVWFRRGRLLMVSPDSLGTACPLSGRNSTYRPVQISGAGSHNAASPPCSSSSGGGGSRRTGKGSGGGRVERPDHGAPRRTRQLRWKRGRKELY